MFLMLTPVSTDRKPELVNMHWVFNVAPNDETKGSTLAYKNIDDKTIYFEVLESVQDIEYQLSGSKNNL